jgi:hypothetical protein
LQRRGARQQRKKVFPRTALWRPIQAFGALDRTPEERSKANDGAVGATMGRHFLTSPGQICCRFTTPRDPLRRVKHGRRQTPVEARRLRHETPGFKRFFIVAREGADKLGRRLTGTLAALSLEL